MKLPDRQKPHGYKEPDYPFKFMPEIDLAGRMTRVDQRGPSEVENRESETTRPLLWPRIASGSIAVDELQHWISDAAAAALDHEAQPCVAIAFHGIGRYMDRLADRARAIYLTRWSRLVSSIGDQGDDGTH